ncbi:amino acid adenylation domain-containing protein [Rhodococcus sp. HM1]|nr:non-ribosomal peptide synthetase [Rhodococcus sp. HM1]MCK8671813.1 amino acid adenylation domain-containing protein [Rhodococcus sp. HM1]
MDRAASTTVHEPFPLSAAQHGLWFAQHLAPDVPICIAQYLDIRGPLDVELFREVAMRAAHEFQSVFLRIVEIDGVPHQVVDPPADAEMGFHDFRAEPDPLTAAQSWMHANYTAPVNFERDHLCESTLLRVGDEHYLWYSRIHHIALDGHGAATMVGRVASLYTAAVEHTVPEPNRAAGLRTLERLEREYRESHRFAADRDYWAQRLDTRSGAATLADRDAPPVATSRTLRTALSDRAAALLSGNDGTAAATLVAAFAHYLSRRTGRREVTVDIPVSARPTAILRRSGGMLANVAPIRVQTRPGDTVGGLVDRVQGELLGALRHQRGNVEDILRDLGADAAARAVTGPMVNVMLFDRHLQFGSLSTDFHILTTGPVPDLVVNVYRSGATVFVEFAANPNRYGDDELRVHHDAVVALVERMLAAGPESRLADLEAPHRTVVGGTAPMPGITLPQLLAEAVAANPDGIALAAPGRRVTYAELDAASNRLARALRAAGVRRESIVAVALTRSVESVTAVWAVAKAGAAFVPVDPNHPAGRIEHMITDSEVTVGVTLSSTVHRLPGSVCWLLLDEPAGDVSDAPITDGDPVNPGQAAYVIYTSGSTGLPKGVVVTHHGLANLVTEQRTRLAGDRNAKVLHCASPSFDASVFEMLWAVGSAATLVIVPPTVYGGDEFTELLRREAVTHMVLTPSVLASLDPSGLDALRVLLVAGEACASELVDRWAPGRTMLDGYGPTEATVMSNLSDALVPGEPVTIGGPGRGFTEVVLDAALRPVPAGVAGELYLGGPALARGYRGRPALTASRFVADPFGEPGARLYRTGDVVRWRTTADGSSTLDYLGRSDFQVKIRGIRVELGEIDAALTAHPDVDFAITVGRPGPGGDTVLVSYVLPADGSDTAVPEAAALIAHLRDFVPSHMIPAAIVVLGELPLTPVGKLDRAALPAPDFARAEYRAPVTGTERAAAAAFAEVLGLDRVGLDDHFFDLGGNSLSATRVVARVNTAVGTEMGVRELFEAPTVAAFAARADAAGRRAGDRPALVAGPRPERVPLSLAQQRMWVVNQVDPTSPAYNVPIALRLTGDLDLDALRAALADVLERHEALRTVHPSSEQGPHQVVLPAGSVTADLTPMPVTGESELRERLRAVASIGFDVSVDVPIRTALFRLGSQEHVVAIVLHHIAADGFSMAPLARDVMLAYTTRAQGQAPLWVPLPAHYVDYTLWQREVVGDDTDPDSLATAQIDFWRHTLDGLPELLELPTDRERTMHRSAHGAAVPFGFGPDLHRAVTELAREHDATVFMVVHAALAVLLGKLAGTADLAIGTPVAGRGDAALDDMVGMFVNTVTLRTRIAPQSTFGELVAQVRDGDLAAFGNADVPFDHVVRALDPVRSSAHSPLFQVLLEFRNLDATRLDLPGLTVETVDIDLEVAKCDLYLSIDETRDRSGAPAGMKAEFGYTTDIFDRSTVDGFARRFVGLLEAVVAEPTRPLGAFDLLDDAERAELVPVSGGASVPAVTLPELFAAAAAADPDAVAVVAGERRLTYRELDEQSNWLARVLIRAGVGPESAVAIAIPRSLESALAVWAVVKTGAAFLPVDPNYPAARIAHMLADSAVTVGVTISDARDALPESVTWLNLDQPCEQASIDRVTDADRVAPLLVEHPAYFIYTSGSTGVPKGVEVTHAGLANLVAEQRTRFGLGPHARVLHAASPSFDAAVLEMLWAFGAGGRLVISPPGVFGGRELADLLAREQVTHVALTPAALGTVDPDGLDHLSTVIVGGEACPPELVARWAPGRTMVNTYGPAETTIQSNAGRALVAGEPVTIGGPIRGFAELVLDERLRPVPVGVVGELYLSGPGSARGYRNRPGLSAARFVAAADGLRMYRTGDLVRWRRREDGTLELDYVGRSDQQVKVRGFRIELGEIESALLGYPGVAHAVAHTDGDRLAGYVVAAPGSEVDVDAVLGHARARLAPHMVPATVTVLARVPVTANGKLDRAALPRPEHTRVAYRAPRDAAETVVADAFAEDLGIDRVGLDDNYFALGGTSLSATVLMAKISDGIGRQVPVQWIFTDPTPESLAHRIATAPDHEADDALAPLLPLRPDGTGTPVFCIHPAIGLAWCFTGLVPYLGDRPVYGLQSPALTDPEARFTDLGDLADRYIEQIRSVQPDGPYHLVGYSVGGQIAHEMAVRLGSEVATLTMLDSHLLGDDDIRREPPTLAELLAEFGDLPAGDTLTAEQAADVLRRTGGLFDAVTPERVEMLHRVFTATVELAVTHSPSASPDLDVLYFAAAESAGDPTAAAAWQAHVAGRIDEHAVRATHQELTSPQALAEIGPELARHLLRADAARTGSAGTRQGAAGHRV